MFLIYLNFNDKNRLDNEKTVKTSQTRKFTDENFRQYFFYQ
ncbi:hypothetical protein E34_0211 [Lactococcus lactis subsp. lactis]|uniref:Uncharacterized protein n=3 Tax=Lactococcus TaxID=1357 RepID=A0A2A5SSI8_LACLC|nr:hypothetical protein llh_1220 [Lactococcus cremoris subsp. cremoris A76]KST80401.1 hypothetical protein E34_0211 [Lactococcus lactis subsp. lactis]KSU07518.1 hypothetical protein LMG8520_1809 [Lactococcus lactis subsp. lactis]PCS13923.1 hypothetical protein RU90_GL001402 [Lactococcus lactis subsp. hordniae]PCS18146.1 hypothetical protein RU92_GL002252 [Lactococcus cremoris subsp. tructae]